MCVTRVAWSATKCSWSQVLKSLQSPECFAGNASVLVVCECLEVGHAMASAAARVGWELAKQLRMQMAHQLDGQMSFRSRAELLGCPEPGHQRG
jgi:hypothetical protein